MNKSNLYEMAKKYENCGEIEKAYQCYLEAAMADSDGEAMYSLALMYFEGDYVYQSYDKAGYYFGLAFDHGAKVKPWTLIIAGGYWKNRANGDAKNYILAEKYYQAAAELGERYGYECLGALYYELGDYDKAYENLKKMNGKNPLGFYYMGRLYEDGHVVEHDMDKAIEMYKKTIEIGSERGEEYGDDKHCALAKKRLVELDIL